MIQFEIYVNTESHFVFGQSGYSDVIHTEKLIKI